MCIRDSIDRGDAGSIDLQHMPQNVALPLALQIEIRMIGQSKHSIFIGSRRVLDSQSSATQGVAHSCRAVSYTHLDVYKRQLLDRAGADAVGLAEGAVDSSGLRHTHFGACLLYTSPPSM